MLLYCSLTYLNTSNLRTQPPCTYNQIEDGMNRTNGEWLDDGSSVNANSLSSVTRATCSQYSYSHICNIIRKQISRVRKTPPTQSNFRPNRMPS